MSKGRRLKEDAHPCLQQIRHDPQRCPVDIDKVVFGGQDDADLNAFFGGNAQNGHDFPGRQKIGCHDGHGGEGIADAAGNEIV